ncbi:MAG: ABC transporter permease [Opitutaceae bacterium]
MEELLQDLRYCCRSLWKSPGFTAVALLTLGIGIGANAAIFSYVDGVFLRPLAYPDADRMVRVTERPPRGGTFRISTLNYLDLERQTSVFECIAAQQWGFVALTGIEIPIEVPSERVRARFFDVFKIRPVLGRTFVEGEDQPGRDHVAVISHAFWVSPFGSDPKIIGRSILLNGEPYTVIGVMPAGAFDLTATRIWRPLAFTNGDMTRDARWYNAWAKLKQGVTLEQARAQLNALALRNAHDFPDADKGWGFAVDSFRSILVEGDVKRSLWLLMAAVGMVLLIACANLTNLTLARGVAREREVAVRAALGAGRWRLVRQFLTESLLLALGGGALGLLVAYGSLVSLKTVIPENYLPPSTYVSMDGRILVFVLALAVLTAVIFGLYPAIKASRPNLIQSIKEGGIGTSTGGSSRGIRAALVVAEVALAFVLLSGAGLLIRSFMRLQQVDTGFDATNVITAWLPFYPKHFASEAEFKVYLRRITDRIGALPGVRDVALTTAIPMQGWGYGMRFQIVGRKPADEAHKPGCYFKMVSPSYFRALGMRLVRGRFLGPNDLSGAAPATVINQTMAKKFFGDEDPIGQQILVAKIEFDKDEPGAEIPWGIVGVVADEKLRGLSAENDQSPGMYVTTDQSPQTYQAVIIRTATDPKTLERAIPIALMDVDRNQTVQMMATLEEIKAKSVGEQRLHSLVLGVFAGVALLLAAIGLYGVISYSLLQRTREIGIRAALGASSANIRWLMLRSGLSLAAAGLLIGFAGSLAAAQVLSSLLFGVGRHDAVTLLSVVSVLGAMALLASYIPARRATRINPIIALRYE